MFGLTWSAVSVMALLLFVGGAGSSAFADQEGIATEEGRHRGMMMGGEMMEMMHGGMGGGGHHAMMGHGDVGERPPISLMLQNRDALQLSPEQVKRLEALRFDFRKAAIKRSADLQVAELELEELRKKEPVDLAKVEAQLKRIEALRAEQRLSRIRAIETGKALLTPEQRQKLDTLGQSEAGHGMTGCPMMSGMIGPSGSGASK